MRSKKQSQRTKNERKKQSYRNKKNDKGSVVSPLRTGKDKKEVQRKCMRNLRSNPAYKYAENENSKIRMRLKRERTRLRLANLRGNEEYKKAENFFLEEQSFCVEDESVIVKNELVSDDELMETNLERSEYVVPDKLRYKNNLVQQQEAESLVCNICGEKVTGRTALRTHQYGMHASKHQCHKCNLDFDTSIGLKEHNAIIHNGKPFRPSRTNALKCAYCSKTFNSKSGRFDHTRNHHPKEYEEARIKRDASCFQKYAFKQLDTLSVVEKPKNTLTEGANAALNMTITKKGGDGQTHCFVITECQDISDDDASSFSSQN